MDGWMQPVANLGIAQKLTTQTQMHSMPALSNSNRILGVETWKESLGGQQDHSLGGTQ